MKVLFSAFITLFVLASTAHAIDLSLTTGSSMKNSSEDSMTWKRSQEQSSGADVQLSMDAVFRPALIALEKKYSPWKSCRVLSHPLMPADVGLSAMIEDGMIDTIKAQYLKEAAESNSDIAELADVAKIKHYRACLALYGAVIGEAYANLQGELGKVAKVSKGANAAVVAGLAREDLDALAVMAMEKTVTATIRNKRIRDLYKQAVEDQEPCRFAGEVNHLVCGSTEIVLAAKPKLSVEGIEMYGEHFAGYSGNYTLKAGNTKNREQVLSDKKSWDREKDGKQSLSPSGLLGHVHE